MSAQPFDIAKVIAPLPGEKPCGESAKYEPEYESLEQEVAKQEGVTPQPVDWGAVLRASQTILESKSKDLLVASYFAYALFDRKGYPGLAAGLKVCAAFVKNFWEDMHPEKKRIRGRIAALEWLATRLERTMDQKRPGGGEAAAVAECVSAFEELEKTTGELLGRDAPDMSKALRLLRDFAQNTAKPVQPAAAPTTTASGTVSTQVATEQDVPKVLRQAQSMVRSVATFIRSQKLEDPRAYRLTRIGAWIMIDQLPMAQNGATQLAGLPAGVAQKYSGYLAEQKFAALIPEVEESFSKAPFWLDAHRLTAAALEGLGATHAAARQTVISELSLFVKRLPGLVDLKFMDGSPFANDQTRLWIEQEVLPAGATEATTAGPAKTAPGGAAAPWLEAQKEARQLAAKGKTAEALALFQNGSAQSKSQRERFCWQLAQARYCFDAGLVQAAMPQLEFLDQQCAHYALEAWEPELSLDVARVLLLCYAQAADKNKKLRETLGPKAEQLYARICRLDLNAALKTDVKVFQQ